MTLPQLDLLPMEVLQAISNTLDTTHRPSVITFSVLNRQCRRAATPALFRTIRISISGPEALASAIARWTFVLHTNYSFRQVQQLFVSGDIYSDWKQIGQASDHYPSLGTSAPFEYATAWLPLAAFIEKLSGLKDLHFDCDGDFPPCLLASLGNSAPMCRLHIKNFSLQSLRRDSTDEVLTKLLELHASDKALIASPNLYSITVTTGGSTSRKSDYTPEAIFQIMSQACPGLREVMFRHTRWKDAPRRAQRKPYPGLRLDHNTEGLMTDSTAKAELIKFSLEGRTEFAYEQWQRHVNFDTLSTLKLIGNIDSDVVVWAAESLSFPSLSCLELKTNGWHPSGSARFLESLPSLKDLTIDEGSPQNLTFKAILSQHAMTLQRLSLPRWVYSLRLSRVLRKNFPSLEHLAVKMFRTEGDASELALYTALGSHPRIQSLWLDLDCSVDVGAEKPWATPPPDAQHREVFHRKQYICRTLINCAIDSNLAADMFRRIASAKSPGSAPLQNIQFNVVNAGVIMTSGGDSRVRRENVYRHFTRTWSCGFDPRDDRPNEVLAAEPKARLRAREQAEADHAIRWPLDVALGLGRLEAAFRDIWPKGAGDDWRNDWRSLPLEDLRRSRRLKTTS
jgi:hypothetical protein